MSLTNEQYYSLMGIYQKRRLNALAALDQKKALIDEKYPALQALHREMAENAASRAKALVLKKTEELTLLNRQKEELRALEKQELQKAGLTASDFLPVYTCPDCQDTGFIEGRKCHCFLQAEISLLYADSNLGLATRNDSFEKIDYSLYTTEKEEDGLSQLEKMQKTVHSFQQFVKDFDTHSQNLLLLGQTGLGKTFFSNCIARELLNTGHSVVYFSAVQLFELFAKNMGSFDRDSLQQMNETLLSSDLLIVDDLGTETRNTYTTGKFFSVINDRLLRGKSTIISSNLSRNQLSDLYGERIASRILSGYEHFLFSGDDLRIKIKLRKL